MFIYLKTAGLFIQMGTWKMSRPKNPGKMDIGLIEAGNMVFGIRDIKDENLIVKCVVAEKYSLLYNLLINNFHDEDAWSYFRQEAAKL
jgi:hypothetical protein